ncbi:hypothetical protein Tco_0250997 [Tanacetum coccineum]
MAADSESNQFTVFYDSVKSRKFMLSDLIIDAAKIQEVLPAESSSIEYAIGTEDDSIVIPDHPIYGTNDNQVDQNAAECVDERAALANLIANLTHDTEENKMIQKQLKKSKRIH